MPGTVSQYLVLYISSAFSLVRFLTSTSGFAVWLIPKFVTPFPASSLTIPPSIPIVRAIADPAPAPGSNFIPAAGGVFSVGTTSAIPPGGNSADTFRACSATGVGSDAGAANAGNPGVGAGVDSATGVGSPAMPGNPDVGTLSAGVIFAKSSGSPLSESCS